MKRFIKKYEFGQYYLSLEVAKKIKRYRRRKTDLRRYRDVEEHLLFLLGDFREIQSGKGAYIKRAATELRLLVTRGKGNNILNRVAREVGFEYRFFIDRNSPKKSPQFVTLEEFLRTRIHGKRIGSGEDSEFKFVDYEKLIKGVVNQFGSAHEDDEIDEQLIGTIELLVDGNPFYHRMICEAVGNTLVVGYRLLEYLKDAKGYEMSNWPKDWIEECERIIQMKDKKINL